MHRLVLIATCVLLGSSWAAAQDHVLTVTDASGTVGSSATILVEYDNNSTDNMAGWSLGVCHDESMVDVSSAAHGSTTLTISGGNPPDFNQINVIPNGSPGIGPGETAGANQAVVISFLGSFTLAPGTDFEIFEVTYTLDQVGTSVVQLCGTTPGGAFPVETSMTVAGGTSIGATQIDGSLTASAAGAPYVLSFSDEVGLTATCLLDSSGGGDIAGWSIGICHDESLVNPLSATSGSTTMTSSASGGAPDFEQINVIPNGTTTGTETPGFNHAVVISLLGGVTLSPGAGYELLDLVYEEVGPAGTATIEYCNTTPGGAFPVDTILSLAGGSAVAADWEDGEIETAVFVPATFIRGDCNADGVLDLSDIVESLEYLFTGGAALPCDDACDVNDDGQIDVADAIHNADGQFFGGPPPPAPSTCGDDPTADALDCADFAACP